MGFWIGPVDAEAKSRLKQCRAAKVPRRMPASRGPRPAELRKVVEKLKDDYVVKFSPENPRANDDWCILVTLRKQPKTGWVLLAIIHLENTTKPLPILFLDNARLDIAAWLAVELARVCVLDGEDSYGAHLVIDDCDPNEVMAAMEKYARKARKSVPRRVRELLDS